MITPKNKMFTKEDIFNQLEKLGAPKDSVVLVHSSYRLVGNFEGGAEKFLDALVEFFTAKGGLLCSARIMKETMELIAKRSGENDPLADEFALSPKLYC